MMEKAQNVADLDDLARVPDHFGAIHAAMGH